MSKKESPNTTRFKRIIDGLQEGFSPPNSELIWIAEIMGLQKGDPRNVAPAIRAKMATHVADNDWNHYDCRLGDLLAELYKEPLNGEPPMTI